MGDDAARIEELEARLRESEAKLNGYENFEANHERTQQMIMTAIDAYENQKNNIQAIMKFTESLPTDASGPAGVENLLDHLELFEVLQNTSNEAATALLEHERQRAAFHKNRARLLREERDQAEQENIQHVEDIRKGHEEGGDGNKDAHQFENRALLQTLASYDDRFKKIRDRMVSKVPAFGPGDEEDEEEVRKDEERPSWPDFGITDFPRALLDIGHDFEVIFTNLEATLEPGAENPSSIDRKMVELLHNDILRMRIKDAEQTERLAEQDEYIRDLTEAIQSRDAVTENGDVAGTDDDGGVEAYTDDDEANVSNDHEDETDNDDKADKDAVIQHRKARLQACESRKHFPEGHDEDNEDMADKYIQLCRDNDYNTRAILEILDNLEPNTDGSDGNASKSVMSQSRRSLDAIRGLRARIADLEGGKGGPSVPLEEHQDQITKLEQTIGDISRDAKRLKNTASSKDEALEDCGAKTAKQADQIEELEDTLEAASRKDEALEKCEARVAMQEAQIEGLQYELELEAAHRNDEALEKCKATVAQQEAQIIELEEDLEETNRKDEALEKYETRVGMLEAQIIELEEEQDGSINSDDRDEAITTPQNSNHELISDFNETKALLDKTNADLKATQEELTQPKSSRANPYTPGPKTPRNKQDADAEENEEDDDEDRLSDLQNTIQFLRTTIEGLNTTIENKEKEIDTLQEGRDKDEQLAALRKLMTELQTQIAQLQKELPICKHSGRPIPIPLQN
jgi:chromosome segregation ATPase